MSTAGDSKGIHGVRRVIGHGVGTGSATSRLRVRRIMMKAFEVRCLDNCLVEVRVDRALREEEVKELAEYLRKALWNIEREHLLSDLRAKCEKGDNRSAQRAITEADLEGAVLSGMMKLVGVRKG